MVCCAVATCKVNVRNKRKFVSFHVFPRNQPRLLRKWLDACKRKDLTELKPWHFICSMHFTPECFNFHLSYDNVKLSLKQGSCPTLNLPRLGNTIGNPVSYEDHIENLPAVQELLRIQAAASTVEDQCIELGAEMTSSPSKTPVIKLPSDKPGRLSSANTELILPPTRVKMIMKSCPDVETVSQETLHVITKATELFIQYLATESHSRASSTALVNYEDLSHTVHGLEHLEFLREAVPMKVTWAEAQRLIEESENKFEGF